MSYFQRDDSSGAPPINEDNIDQIEEEAIYRASHMITVLDSSLAQWDAIGQVPPELRMQFNQYRIVLERINRWETEMLKSRGKGGELQARMKKLSDYVEIFYSLKVSS